MPSAWHSIVGLLLGRYSGRCRSATSTRLECLVKLRCAIACTLVFGSTLATSQVHAKSKRNGADSRPTATVTSHTSLPIITPGAEKIVVQYVNPLHHQYSLQVSSTSISAPTPPASKGNPTANEEWVR